MKTDLTQSNYSYRLTFSQSARLPHLSDPSIHLVSIVERTKSMYNFFLHVSRRSRNSLEFYCC